MDSFDYSDDGLEATQDSTALIWNILTVVVVLMTVCMCAGFGLLLINPQSSLNPYPRSTMPVEAEMPTVTLSRWLRRKLQFQPIRLYRPAPSRPLIPKLHPIHPQRGFCRVKLPVRVNRRRLQSSLHPLQLLQKGCRLCFTLVIPWRLTTLAIKN